MLEGSYCKTCGKEFFPTPLHVYKDTRGVYCCWTCYNHRASKKKGIYAYRVERYDLEGNFLDIYDSADIAAEAFGIIGRYIQKACREGTPYGGYLWKYAKDKKPNFEGHDGSHDYD